MNEESMNTVTREIAEEDFGRICKAARVKWELYRTRTGKADADGDRDRTRTGKADADGDRESIVDAIMDGEITVDADGWPTVHTEHDSDKLKDIKIFRRPIRGDKLAMDRTKEGQNIQAQDSIMGKFLGLAAKELQALEETDYSRVESLWLLFLGY
jgi:hypothetical protein